MSRLSIVVTILCSVGLWGCGAEGAKVLPQSGDWSITSTGFSNDDCNASNFLIPFDEITVSDLEASSFAVTYYLENVRIGESSSTCSDVGDDNFDCTEIAHSTPFSDAATINMTAIGSLNMTSETSITGSGNLTLDCTGVDCNQLEEMYTGSLPCDTTLNWTAIAN